IKQYLTQRYGDYVLFSPPLKMTTLILWLLPLLLGTAGCLLAVIYFRSRQEVRA
ncbi:MAG: cytochrome c-type biogenesis protein CcmH, partial [Coxiellaceae bacterium]|nr:cytochrome c-type biogenesis protein CcmH [Coxiellaceae bacterium]